MRNQGRSTQLRDSGLGPAGPGRKGFQEEGSPERGCKTSQEVRLGQEGMAFLAERPAEAKAWQCVMWQGPLVGLRSEKSSGARATPPSILLGPLEQARGLEELSSWLSGQRLDKWLRGVGLPLP